MIIQVDFQHKDKKAIHDKACKLVERLAASSFKSDIETMAFLGSFIEACGITQAEIDKIYKEAENG